MKIKLIISVLVVTALISSVSASLTFATETSNMVAYDNNCGNFNDISSNDTSCWLYQSIREKNVFTGDGNGDFRPNDPISRAEFTKILVVTLYGNDELLINSTTNRALSFWDLTIEKQWFYPYLRIAKNKALIGGYPDGSFQPNNNVTRAEFAKMLYSKLPDAYGNVQDARNYMFSRYADLNPYDELGFEAGQWYSDWITVLYYSDSWGAFLEDCGGQLCPERAMTRKEIAAAIDKLSRAFDYEWGFTEDTSTKDLPVDGITDDLNAQNCLNIRRLSNMTGTLESMGLDTGVMAKCYDTYRSTWMRCNTLWDWKRVYGVSGLSTRMSNNIPKFTSVDSTQCAIEYGPQWHYEIDYYIYKDNCRKIRNLADRTATLNYLGLEQDMQKQCADAYRPLWDYEE